MSFGNSGLIEMYASKRGLSLYRNRFRNPAVTSCPAIILNGAMVYFFSRYGINSMVMKSKNCAPFSMGNPFWSSASVSDSRSNGFPWSMATVITSGRSSQ